MVNGECKIWACMVTGLHGNSGWWGKWIFDVVKKENGGKTKRGEGKRVRWQRVTWWIRWMVIQEINGEWWVWVA